MHEHDHESGAESLRPKAGRLDEPDTTLHMRAALSGRPDAAGLLGLQRAAGNAGTATLLEPGRSPVHGVVNSGGGSPLDADTRADMEARLGQDFSDVRVHTDGAAHESAKAVDAHAYTVGTNIVFQRGKYDPTSAAGKHMLAHELTHVVQQRSGPVDGTDTGGGVRVSDPSDRFEREAVATADRVMSAPVPTARVASAAPGATGAVQRCGDGCEESAQTYVQRDVESIAPGVHSSVQRAEERAAEEETAQTFVQRTEGDEEETAQTYVQRAETEGAEEETEQG